MDELNLMLKNNTDLVTKCHLDKGSFINDVTLVFILISPPHFRLYSKRSNAVANDFHFNLFRKFIFPLTLYFAKQWAPSFKTLSNLRFGKRHLTRKFVLMMNKK